MPKSDRTIRLCGDYKVTVNRDLEVDKTPCLFPSYPILSSAYQQMPLEEESHQYITINIHHSRYRYTWLPFGIASAPIIFQAMYAILQGLEHVICYLDDF